MAMSRPQPVNAVLVGAASAAFHGTAAVLTVPWLSFILLTWRGAPAQGTEALSTETGMVFALVAPVLAAVFGFVAGALMALAYNLFADHQRKLVLATVEARKVRAATLGNAA